MWLCDGGGNGPVAGFERAAAAFQIELEIRRLSPVRVTAGTKVNGTLQ